MSKNQDRANQRAFERGQSDCRDGKGAGDNPYPIASPYHNLWEQGWQSEHKAQHD